MAQCETKITKTYILTLSDIERAFLRGLLQNYMGPVNEESEADHNLRVHLFNVLNKRED